MGRIPARGSSTAVGKRPGNIRAARGTCRWCQLGVRRPEEGVRRSRAPAAGAARHRRAPVREGGRGRVRKDQWEVGELLEWPVCAVVGRRGKLGGELELGAAMAGC
jgi:hypothetical protein